MYFKKYRTHISLFFIISLLLCGMCFENIQTDSSFLCSTFCEDLDEDDFSLHFFEPDLPLEQVYSPELPGQRQITAAMLRSAPKSSVTPDRKGCHALSSSVTCPHILYSIFMYHSNTAIYAVNSNIVILGYIHHQDGKKSNILF